MAHIDQAGEGRGSGRSGKKGSEKAAQAESNKLHIGEGVVVRGEVSVPDTVVVDGLLEGEVKTHRLIVGQTGTVKGKVEVTGNADVYGRTVEHLDVKNLLVVRGTGSIEGTVSYGELLIERGGSVAGGISSADYKPSGDGPRPGGGSPVRRPPKPPVSPKDNLDMRKRVFPPVSYVSPTQAMARNAAASGGEAKGRRKSTGND